MKSASLTNGSGPGSAIALSATSIRVRDAIIEKFIDKSLDELNSFLTSALDSEKDESKRIGILAARVYILRTRISKITEYNENPLMDKVEEVSPHELVNSFEDDEPEIMFDADAADDEMTLEDWNELVTIDAGEVNGVRIPRGVTITVGREDAARLIEMGKAVKVAEDGSVLEDDMSGSADTLPESPSEPAPQPADDSTDESSIQADAAAYVQAEDASIPAESMPADEMTDSEIADGDALAAASSAEQMAAEDISSDQAAPEQAAPDRMPPEAEAADKAPVEEDSDESDKTQA